MDKTRIYLGHNPTTRTRGEVRQAMGPDIDRALGDPSSIHSFGQQAKKGSRP